ncbi:hypothetical protein SAMN02745751_02936 [Dethiosulfatibacter aminovorans DSM 17477]|uniref:Mpv17 / PMP22 family protein n=1 Tax=Dethiosulfatibacter aminovorans DSM 17477 TaxID=1121476 RepID=A0A1M6KN33_9FIRM|nr:hypothetical protein [Dethiosulfatibacter aminovorans]SHJ60320.1 hypothetical protein SAMN02745751_02936 [Dethiosulfatibacter aminovorans DSM 17477]
MNKGDFLWIGGIALVVLFIVSPQTNPIFLSLTSSHPYMMAFAKFGILATMGELLAHRIRSGKWTKPVGMMYKAVVWGFFGILITLAFQLFTAGVVSAQAKGYLPGEGSGLMFAFFTSSTMNLFFAPVFMACHKCTDSYINLSVGGIIKKPTLDDVLKDADWNSYVNFVLLKTVPFFWIPAHTITFLLPGEYRIVAAAFLSIALGAFLALANKKKTVALEPCLREI